MTKIQKLEVDHVFYDGSTFHCQCVNPEITTTVSYEELLMALDADYMGRIPQVDNPGAIDERHYFISPAEWLDSAGISGTCKVLAEIIAARPVMVSATQAASQSTRESHAIVDGLIEGIPGIQRAA